MKPALALHHFQPSEEAAEYCGYQTGKSTHCGYPEGSAMHAVLKVQGAIGGVPVPDDLLVDARYQPAGVHTPRQPGEQTRYDTHAGTITLDDPMSTMQGLMVFFDQCVELAGKKDAVYRKAWQRQGYMGNLARVLSKVERLRAMMWHDFPDFGQETQETVKDTLKDLANLCGFLARNWDEGNKWGSQ